MLHLLRMIYSIWLFLLQWFISGGLFVYGKWSFQFLGESYGNGYSYGYLFMANGLFNNSNKL